MYLEDVPSEIREKYKLIGKGQTALVFDKGDTVLIVTRDPMKVEWLTQPWGLQMGRVVKELEGSVKHPLSKKYTVYVIEMPKLRKLSPENRRKVKSWLKDLRQAEIDTNSRNPHVLYEWFMRNRPDHSLVPALEFALNYNLKDHDIALRNFMEDSKGNIILLDPFVADEIAEFIHGSQKSVGF